MIALFLSIATVTATIAAAVLFYVFPTTIPKEVKADATVLKPQSFITTVPVESVSAEISQDVSPTPQKTSKPKNVLKVTSTDSSKITSSLSATPNLTLSSSPSPTFSPSVSFPPTGTPTPTYTVSPTASPSSIPIPTLSPAAPVLGLNADTIFTLVNTQRSANGLPSLQKNNTVCSIANQRAPQVYDEIFTTGKLDSGLKAMNLSYWLTENIINDSSEQDAVDWWMADSSHRQVILGNYKYSCVACSGFNCAQIFTSLVPK